MHNAICHQLSKWKWPIVWPLLMVGAAVKLLLLCMWSPLLQAIQGMQVSLFWGSGDGVVIVETLFPWFLYIPSLTYAWSSLATIFVHSVPLIVNRSPEYIHFLTRSQTTVWPLCVLPPWLLHVCMPICFTAHSFKNCDLRPNWAVWLLGLR